jgi:hypothetical protein
MIWYGTANITFECESSTNNVGQVGQWTEVCGEAPNGFWSSVWNCIHNFDMVPRFLSNLCTPDIKHKVCPILKWWHDMGSQFFSKLSLKHWTHPSSLTATKCKLCQYTGRPWHLYSVQEKHTKNTRNCCTHVTGKFQHKMLNLPTGQLYIGQWQNTLGVGVVTNSTANIIQERNFCHDVVKTLPRQLLHGSVVFCYKAMTPQWNHCASFLVVTVI